ncbi:inositol 1,4,5-trisphosphate receptor-interacting protein-like 1 [Chlamydotis macqueenii]
MVATRFFVVLVTNIIQHLQMVGDELDEATRERMQQRAEQLSREMSRLLLELDQRMQEQVMKEQGTQEQDHMLFGALQQWFFWAIAAIVITAAVTMRAPAATGSRWTRERKKTAMTMQMMWEGFLTSCLSCMWPMQNLVTDCLGMNDLVCNFILVFRELFSNSFLPVLQPAIEVGSAFEGWSPCGKDLTFRFLVPLKPRYGHGFHLEPSTAEKMPVRNFYIRMEVECTCTRERLAGKMLCFLHNPEPELRRNQDPSLLGTLCTDSYLDAWKTACWFQKFVSSAWVMMPQSHHYTVQVLPSSRSCILQLTNASGRTLLVELMFGVQHGNSDIFLSSGSAESLFTSSTTWPESYAVAEAKFFRHVARQAPRDSFHLNCLQLCARILVGIGFSTATLKTVVMHLLTTIPLSGWRRRDLLPRLQDIMQYLHLCLEKKSLDHFFLGNERVPEEIVLPPDLQSAEPFNLFQHLQQDPDAHAKALQEFNELQDRLSRLLFYAY